MATFANQYQALLPADTDPDLDIIKYLFINKLPNEVQTPRAVDLYEEEKNFDEITKKCHKVYKHLLLNRGNKRSWTQVNAIEDDGKEEEQEKEGQAAVHLVDDNTSHQRKEKPARMDQEPALAATNAAFVAPTSSFEPGLGVV